MAEDWRTTFAARMLTAEDAAKKVKSGDKVGVSGYLSDPTALVNALVNRADELSDVEIIHGMTPGDAPYVQPGMETHFIHNSMYMGGVVRPRRDAGHPVKFTPVFFHEWPHAIRRGFFHYDVAFIAVSMPEADGTCSFGIDCSYSAAIAEAARTVIVQVSSTMPRTGGYRFNLSEADFIVEAESPLYPLTLPAPSEVEMQIGRHIATLIPDGATIQCGIGGIPNAVLEALKSKNDLGVHSEMLTEKMKELVELGVITGKNKSMHVGKLIATNLSLGSLDYYHWTDRNPLIELYPVDYVNDLETIRRQSMQISINSAVEVDLQGQANAEMVRGRQYSGIGGQLDFFRGVRACPTGKSFLALPSTGSKGKISKIVSGLKPGTPVTSTRNDFDYLVTEYGVARMFCKSLRERAEQLIAIAHPDFRDQLREEMKEVGIR